MASWRLSFTTSSIYESSDLEDEFDCHSDYSVSEISESFTFR